MSSASRAAFAALSTAPVRLLACCEPPATAERVRRLEAAGVIRGFAALVDARTVGCPLTAFVGVTLERPTHREAFLQRVQEMPEILECHHVAGEEDYLLKIRCRTTLDLERVISERLKGLAGVARTRTTIVLSTSKETTVAPVDAGGDE